MIDPPADCEVDYSPLYWRACIFLSVYIFGTWISEIYKPLKKKWEDEAQREFNQLLDKALLLEKIIEERGKEQNLVD